MQARLKRIIALAQQLLGEVENYELIRELAANAAALLDPLKPMGTELFNAIAAVTISVAVDVVALRDNGGTIEVFLIQRADDDTAYPGQWHCPGSIMRPGEDEHGVLNRVASGDFKAAISHAEIVDFYNLPGEVRGHFVCLIALVEFCGEPTGGSWFPIGELPDTTLEQHRAITIPKAKMAF